MADVSGQEGMLTPPPRHVILTPVVCVCPTPNFVILCGNYAIDRFFLSLPFHALKNLQCFVRNLSSYHIIF